MTQEQDESIVPKIKSKKGKLPSPSREALGKLRVSSPRADAFVRNELLAKFGKKSGAGDAYVWIGGSIAALTMAARLMDAMGLALTPKAVVDTALEKERMQELLSGLREATPEHPLLHLATTFFNSYFFVQEDVRSTFNLMITTEARKAGFLTAEAEADFERYVRENILPMIDWKHAKDDTSHWANVGVERLYASAMLLKMLDRPLDVEAILDLALSRQRFKEQAELVKPGSPFANRLKAFLATDKDATVTNLACFNLGLGLKLWAPKTSQAGA